jgi:hypothetical protein
VIERQLFLAAAPGGRRRQDPVGHALVILKAPSARRAVGFSPDPGPNVEPEKMAFWYLTRRGVAGELLDDA